MRGFSRRGRTIPAVRIQWQEEVGVPGQVILDHFRQFGLVVQSGSVNEGDPAQPAVTTAGIPGIDHSAFCHYEKPPEEIPPVHPVDLVADEELQVVHHGGCPLLIAQPLAVQVRTRCIVVTDPWEEASCRHP